MKEKLKCLSLFSNVGIAEAYFEEIGIDVVIANELVKERAKFYSDVYPKTKMICGDITNDVLRTDIIKQANELGVNMILATPPCQGMSRVGKMEKLDIRNQLIYYAVDAIKRIKPKFVIIENVTTILKTKILVNGKEKLIPEYLTDELGDDYNFNKETKVKAMYYSIPQMRYRNIYLLVRKDIPIVWEFPKHTREVNLMEALGSLPSVDPFLREGIELTLEKFPDYEKKRKAAEKISKWHKPPTHSWRMVEWMMHTPSGESAIYNEFFYPKKENGERIKAHYNQYRRLAWDTPARCITQNNGVISSLACVHPGRKYELNGEILYSEPRVLTIYELLIVSSLPLDWPIPDWANENLIRKVIGEGIPSRLLKVILEELILKLAEVK